MIINGVELEFDALDVNMLKAVKAEQQNLEEYTKSIMSSLEKDEIDDITALERICDMYFEFFNKIFGQGTDKKIFGEKKSLNLIVKAFEEFISQKDKQTQAFEKRCNAIQAGKRQQRRSKK